MALDTGRYLIQNARSLNFLTLPDPDDGSPIIATAEENDLARRWNIVQLGNGKYTIENQTHAAYANTGNRATPGTQVVGKGAKQQFLIQETRKKTNYTISPTDVQLCWSTPDDQEGTPLELSPAYTDPRNHWIFTRVRN